MSNNNAPFFSPRDLMALKTATVVEWHADTPELKLRIAVLEDALTCVLKDCSVGGYQVRNQRLKDEANNWFADDDTLWPFSFVSICYALHLDPDYFRRGLKQCQGSPQKAGKKGRSQAWAGGNMRVAA